MNESIESEIACIHA